MEKTQEWPIRKRLLHGLRVHLQTHGLAEFGQEVVALEGFGQKYGLWLEQCGIPESGVAGHIYDAHLWPHRGQFSCQSAAIHFRHDDIRQEQMDRLLVSLRD